MVYENAFFQLIEYKPLTEAVFERPFLLVPPCINKFYILDLQPKTRSSATRSNRARTFVVSWRNPDESMSQATWDDYIEQAAIQAIETVRDLTGARK